MSAEQTLATIFDVTGKRAVVTGAASGLGFAMAEVLADCGAHVTLADVNPELVEASARQLADRGLAARSFVVDVSDERQVRALFDDVVAAEGGVDIVFANAGISTGGGFAVGGERIDTVDPESWERGLAINLSGVIWTMKHAAAAMKKQGTGGRIVLTSSVAGLQAEPVVGYAYVATKAALVNVVRQAALDLAPDNILVNAICPGPFKHTRIGGDVTFKITPETEAMWASMIPLRRMAEPEELKGLVLFLASGASSFVTGTMQVIDGGAVAATPGPDTRENA
jgi:NAD(P)-dependent dehydrogenase (short-subunit alcohol dehydrogenase family)